MAPTSCTQRRAKLVWEVPGLERCTSDWWQPLDVMLPAASLPHADDITEVGFRLGLGTLYSHLACTEWPGKRTSSQPGAPGLSLFSCPSIWPLGAQPVSFPLSRVIAGHGLVAHPRRSPCCRHPRVAMQIVLSVLPDVAKHRNSVHPRRRKQIICCLSNIFGPHILRQHRHLPETRTQPGMPPTLRDSEPE
jgi:hypothetical protein